VERTLIGAKVV